MKKRFDTKGFDWIFFRKTVYIIIGYNVILSLGVFLLELSLKVEGSTDSGGFSMLLIPVGLMYCIIPIHFIALILIFYKKQKHNWKHFFILLFSFLGLNIFALFADMFLALVLIDIFVL